MRSNKSNEGNKFSREASTGGENSKRSVSGKRFNYSFEVLKLELPDRKKKQ